MANAKPVKILEIAGNNWMGGISLHPNIAVGGLFRSASNFDPFERIGVYKPTVAPTQRGSATISTAGAFNVGFSSGSISYFYSFGNSSAVYRVKTIDATVTNQSAQISGITTIRGAAKFKSRILYANDSTVKANALILALGSEVNILTGLNTANHVMQIAPDRNLYLTNLNSIGRITNIAGTSGNSATYLTFEDDVVTRDLCTDGKHLVILGDRNELVPGSLGRFSCFVAFWNMKSQDLTQYWEFEDNAIYGMEAVEDEIIVFGSDNIYICSVNAQPRPLMLLRGIANITSGNIPVGSITRRGNGQVLWSIQGKVYGYGRVHSSLPKILFQPYSLDSGNVTSLFTDGATTWAMSDENKLFDFSFGSRNSSTLFLTDVDFKIPYRFAFAKVVLQVPLSSGLSVDLQISSQDGNKLITTNQSFDFATYGAKSSHIYYPKPLATSQAILFEEMVDFRITNTKTAVRRFEVWAYPVEPAQNLG